MKGAVIGGEASGSRGSDLPSVVTQKPPHGGFFFAFSTALHAWRCVDDFVQVNLNRFTSLPGFFNAAHEAGKHTFTVDPDYLWYGMLLSKL